MIPHLSEKGYIQLVNSGCKLLLSKNRQEAKTTINQFLFSLKSHDKACL